MTAITAFEKRAPACTLLVFIDDATSRLMILHFTATESTFSYFEATRRYIEEHGKPLALYIDKASVFHCNNPATTADKGITQFGRALYELNIDILCANNSQAKGRDSALRVHSKMFPRMRWAFVFFIIWSTLLSGADLTLPPLSRQNLQSDLISQMAASQ